MVDLEALKKDYGKGIPTYCYVCRAGYFEEARIPYKYSNHCYDGLRCSNCGYEIHMNPMYDQKVLDLIAEVEELRRKVG